MKEGLVSIIMPCFNASSFIQETIQTVQLQTYTHWELIIIDDYSTDDSIILIEEQQQKDSRIQLITLPENKGTGVSRNLGIEKARGEFIAFLDADDVWKPKKLEKQLQFMKEKSAAVSFTSYEQIDEVGNTLQKVILAKEKVTAHDMLIRNYIGNLTGIYNAKTLGKIYMPEWRKRQDWALWLFCIQKAKAAFGLQENLAGYRVRTSSISAKKSNLLIHNYIFYRKGCKFGVLKSAYYLSRFLYHHFFKRKEYITTSIS